VSKKADWRFQFEWVERNRELFTRQAYSYFVATVCIEDAVRQRAGVSAYARLLRAFLFRGKAAVRSASDRGCAIEGEPPGCAVGDHWRRAAAWGVGQLAMNMQVSAEFLGVQRTEAVREWMQRARVLCNPNVTAANGDTEGLGMVFAEAQATGLPVVSGPGRGL
jgi:glycosyltransferase involved in cell wall biosynthesis